MWGCIWPGEPVAEAKEKGSVPPERIRAFPLG